MNIKQLLSETMPEDMTLSEREKAAIRQRIHVNKKPKLSFKLFPLVTLIFMSMIGYVLFTSFNDSAASKFTSHEEIIIPETYQSSLHRSIYDSNNHELIFTKEDGAYTYSISEKVTEKIASFSSTGAQHSFTANEKWLVWGDFNNEDYTLNILNRETKEIKVMPSINPVELTLEDNTLFYSNFYTNDHQYYVMDLNTERIKTLHSVEEIDSMRGHYQDGKAAILEIVEDVATVFVYDILSGKLIQKQSTLPYSSVYNMYVVEDRVYFDFATNDGRLKLGYLDIQTGAVQMVKSPDYSFSSVYNNYLALSVTEQWGAETDDVELFSLEDNVAVPYSNFPKIKDRLVTPQFSSDGTLRMVEENYFDGGPTIHLIKP